MAERGLVMVSDPELLDAVLRVAAAAGCELERAVDPTQARRTWSRAPVVLLDAPAARRCTQARLPRRPGVVVGVVRQDGAGCVRAGARDDPRQGGLAGVVGGSAPGGRAEPGPDESGTRQL